MLGNQICVISTSAKPYPASYNVVEILRAIVSEEKVHVLRSQPFTAKVPKFAKHIAYMLDELMISIKLLKILPKINVILIFQEYHLFPTLIARLSQKKVVLFVGGSAGLGSFYREQTNVSFLGKIVYASNVLLADFCNNLSHMIVSVTPSMVNSINLGRYREKIYFAPIFPSLSHRTLFDIKKRYDKRERVIGFVGGLEKIKGIINFADAVPYIYKQLDSVHIVIIGNGALSDTVKLKLKEYCASGAVKILGWAPYTMLPNYYNDFKLLVLPSYSEGVPSVMLEAMSCGTPVLATPVGGIPDIIKDGETGFLLRSNDPKHIANKIVELLNIPVLLEKVSKNACKWVGENFSYKKTLEAWQNIFEQLQSNN